MLTGRESLTRLIGKRRRFLANRQSILSAPIQSCLNGGTALARSAGRTSTEPVGHGPENLDTAEASSSDWVDCPVCGTAVRGDDLTINSHLDACLARGTKRKMTQRTLLELNFCSRSEVTFLHGSSVVPNGFENNIMEDNNTLSTSDGAEELARDPLVSCFELNGQSNDYNSKENLLRDCNNFKFQTSKLPCDNDVPISDKTVTMDNISGAVLDTYIVGRKFTSEKEVSLGEGIALLRDPNNVKDPNAVKVLSADSDPSKLLGFLPRELARYLSPIIQKYDLTFEGRVTSVPKGSLDVVPIQIVYQKPSSCPEDLETLWKVVLCVVESMKTDSPSTTKYQQNFCLLIREFLRNNSHLLTDEERIFLESFTMLSDDSQRLLVRLYTRKGPWFRTSNISYPEILNFQKALTELLATRFLCSFDSTARYHDDEVKDVLNVLTVSELREILILLKKKGGSSKRKQDLVTSLFSLYQGGLWPLLPNMVLERTEVCVRISSTAESLFWRAQRLFFLNGDQDLSAFLLVDLGVIRYPAYRIIVTNQVFATRRDFLAYEEAIEVAQIMDESLDGNNNELVLRCTELSDYRIANSSATADQSVATFLGCFCASWVYSKVVLLGISFLEREHRYNDAVIFLKRLLTTFTCDRRRGYWTLRLSIDLEHLNCLNESLSVAEDGLLDPWVRAGSRMALQRRILRLGKPPMRWKIPNFSTSIRRKITEVQIQGRPLNCITGTKIRFYGEDGEQCGVEQLALQYYAEAGGWQGVHTESGIWLTIFALLMWDIIFSDVPDVFHNEFQNAPLDLETDSFYIRRKGLIEPRLQKIKDGMAEEILITSWESHMGTTCRGLKWESHSLSELRAAVSCIGGPCLSSLCRHLAQDYQSWSSGMPDLLLWRFNGNYRGEAKLVEVKGPRDRLSEQQRAWLLFLIDCGFNAEVCKVCCMSASG